MDSTEESEAVWRDEILTRFPDKPEDSTFNDQIQSNDSYNSGGDIEYNQDSRAEALHNGNLQDDSNFNQHKFKNPKKEHSNAPDISTQEESVELSISEESNANDDSSIVNNAEKSESSSQQVQAMGTDLSSVESDNSSKSEDDISVVTRNSQTLDKSDNTQNDLLDKNREEPKKTNNIDSTRYNGYKTHDINAQSDQEFSKNSGNTSYDSADAEKVGQESISLLPHLLPLVIGLNRKHLAYIESRTSTEVFVNYPNNDYQTRSELVIRGVAKERSRAIRVLRKIIQKVRSQTDYSVMLLPSSIESKIAGSSGSNLRQIERQTQTTINIHHDWSNPYCSIISLAGAQQAIDQAKYLLRKQIKYALSEQASESIELSALASRLIDNNEPNGIMKIIKRLSGAYCYLKNTLSGDSNENQTLVYITGTGVSRQKARYLINEFIMDLNFGISSRANQEAHMILTKPFPTAGFIGVTQMQKSRDYLLDTVISKEQDRSRGDHLLNCISNYNAGGISQIEFGLKPKQDLMLQLFSRISDFVSRIASKEFSSIKLELYFGKQRFRFYDDEYPPVEGFSVPQHSSADETELRSISNSTSQSDNENERQKLSEFFKGAVFMDEISENDMMDKAKQHLIYDGFVEQYRSVHKHRMSFDVYWKNLENSARFMTKLHMDTETEKVELVHLVQQKSTPLTITFLHPVTHADFQIRLVLGSEIRKMETPEAIDSLIRNLKICFNESNNDDMLYKVDVGGVPEKKLDEGPDRSKTEISLDYPLLFNMRHNSIVLKKKTRMFKEDFKVSFQRNFHHMMPLPSGPLANELTQQSKPIVVQKNEVTISNTKLNNILKRYCAEYEAMELDGQGLSNLAIKSETVSSTSVSQGPADIDTQFGISEKLKLQLASELGKLVTFGETMSSIFPWELQSKSGYSNSN